MAVITVLLGVSLILFFGFFAEFIFKKTNIPDVLLLIILGFMIGPNLGNYVDIGTIRELAPIFTTFTLLFLLFDGAFNISLTSLLREFSQSLNLTLFNFFISSAIIATIMWFFNFSWLISLLTGFMLGGVSSAFVIPVLKEMKIGEKMYSLLALESALTDVFCIVASLTVIELITLGNIGIQSLLTQLASLFAVAGLIGIIGGIVWIVLIIKVFKQHNYMMTIAMLLFIYAITEFLQGNGAIAALFFGLMLKNSKPLTSILKGIVTHKAKEKKKAMQGELGVSVTTPSEQFFYHQISFFLKTFFFVYIGLLIDISDTQALIIGGILSVVIMISRMSSLALTRKMEPHNKSLVNSIFARGLAAAAIAQLAIINIPPEIISVAILEMIMKIAFITITGTIILSSIRIFFVKRQLPEPQK